MEDLMASCFFRIILGAVIGHLAYKLMYRITKTTISIYLVVVASATGIVLSDYPYYFAFDSILKSVSLLVGVTFGYWLGARKKSKAINRT